MYDYRNDSAASYLSVSGLLYALLVAQLFAQQSQAPASEKLLELQAFRFGKLSSRREGSGGELNVRVGRLQTDDVDRLRRLHYIAFNYITLRFRRV